jgi:hypothetical protein
VEVDREVLGKVPHVPRVVLAVPQIHPGTTHTHDTPPHAREPTTAASMVVESCQGTVGRSRRRGG